MHASSIETTCQGGGESILFVVVKTSIRALKGIKPGLSSKKQGAGCIPGVATPTLYAQAYENLYNIYLSNSLCIFVIKNVMGVYNGGC